MKVQGLINPSHLITMALRYEYAFSVSYKSGVEIRVGHHKGTWTVARMKNGEVLHWVAFGDNADVMESSDEMVGAFVKSLVSNLPIRDGENNFRDYPARVLENTIGVIGGRPSNVESIEVVQPGRNAWVERETGAFTLSPDGL
jgi:hypothetical protein